MKISGNYAQQYIGSYSSTAKKTNISDVKLPDFNSYLYNTKTPPAMSEDEYKEAITAMAKKDAAAGKMGAAVYSESKSAEFLALKKSFVSVVSPDRQTLISDGLNQMKSALNGSLQEKEERFPTLLEFVLGTAKITWTGEKYEVNTVKIHDKKGNLTADYVSGSNGGWSFAATEAERARDLEFTNIYMKSWQEAFEANGSNPREYIVDDTSRVVKRL